MKFVFKKNKTKTRPKWESKTKTRPKQDQNKTENFSQKYQNIGSDKSKNLSID